MGRRHDLKHYSNETPSPSWSKLSPQRRVTWLNQSCFVETMRASVVLRFAFLALVFVAAYTAAELTALVSKEQKMAARPVHPQVRREGSSLDGRSLAAAG
ncbi:hypothetical protein LSAT2_020481 [Lamellibrachia satsuma]|nr:hypothetical protein LSAT2_020481 [Lamellibrachia satsuma]